MILYVVVGVVVLQIMICLFLYREILKRENFTLTVCAEHAKQILKLRADVNIIMRTKSSKSKKHVSGT
jgi:hypothetical protein